MSGWYMREEMLKVSSDFSLYLFTSGPKIRPRFSICAVRYGWCSSVPQRFFLFLTWLGLLNDAVVLHGSALSGYSHFVRPEGPHPIWGTLIFEQMLQGSWAPSETKLSAISMGESFNVRIVTVLTKPSSNCSGSSRTPMGYLPCGKTPETRSTTSDLKLRFRFIYSRRFCRGRRYSLVNRFQNTETRWLGGFHCPTNLSRNVVAGISREWLLMISRLGWVPVNLDNQRW